MYRGEKQRKKYRNKGGEKKDRSQEKEYIAKTPKNEIGEKPEMAGMARDLQEDTINSQRSRAKDARLIR